MAMEPVPTAPRPGSFGSSFGGSSFGGGPKGPKGGKGGKGSPRKRDGEGRPERDRTGGKYTPKLLGKAYFQRKKGCPFSGPKAPKIDYKDVRLLTKYVSDYGKIMPRHLTGVCALKQRELAQAVKRARVLGLLGYITRPESDSPRPPRGDRPGFERGPRPEGRTFDRTPREERTARVDAAPAAAAE